MIADLLWLKASEHRNSGIEATNQVLKNESGLDFDELASISFESFNGKIPSACKSNRVKFENLADIFFWQKNLPTMIWFMKKGKDSWGVPLTFSNTSIKFYWVTPFTEM